MTKNEQAYQDGVVHFFEGYVYEANPYVNSHEMRAWERGWADANNDESIGDQVAFKLAPKPVRKPLPLASEGNASGFVLYAGYGANTNKASMAQRCPSARYVGRATMPGWKLVFRGVADIVPAWEDSCEISLWEIDADAERSLDHFEGFPNLYQKTWAVATSSGGEPVPVLIYVMRGRDGRSGPSANYEACLREGYADCGMDPAQIDRAIKSSKPGTTIRQSKYWTKK